jgi:hypothetical protein
MIAMRSAHSASILSMVKSKRITVTAATLIQPLADLDPTYVISHPLQADPPKPPVDSADV